MKRADHIPATRRWLRRAGALALTAASVPALWLAGNLLTREAAPPPLYRETDLAALPSPADNGWVELNERVRSTPAIPSDLTNLAKWADVTARREAIDALLAGPEAARVVAAVERAVVRPAFADACPIDFTTRCSWVSLLRAHQLDELAIFRRAVHGDDGEALSAGVRLLRADASTLASPRTLIAQATALASTDRTLVTLDVVLQGHASGGAGREPIDASALRDGLQALDRLGPGSIDLRSAVIGEYVLAVRGFELVSLGLGERALFDRGQTLRLLGAQFAPLVAFAGAGGSRPPDPPRLATGLYWLHNPTGKLLLDAETIDAPSLIERAHGRREGIVRHRDALRGRLLELGAGRL